MASDPAIREFLSKVKPRLASSPSSRQAGSSTTNSHTGTTEPQSDSDQASGYTLSPSSLSVQEQPRTLNVVLCGEIGVGQASVINLIARKQVAKVSSDVNGRTMQSTRYDISFDDTDFVIFDTIGLEEPQIGINGYLRAVEKAYELITKLSAAGGIHLLLFCMRGGRITDATQSNYRLFVQCLCNQRVPIALVFTGLEREVVMEDWWTRNKYHIEQCGIKSSDHACITAVSDGTPEGDFKCIESERRIRELLRTCALKGEAFRPETYPWFAGLGRGMKIFIKKHRSLKRRDVLLVLTQRCQLDPQTARKIADMMERGNTETRDGNGNEQVQDRDKSDPVVGRDENTAEPDLHTSSGGLLRPQLPESQREADRLSQIPYTQWHKHKCEFLHARGRSIEAAESLLEIVNNMSEAVKADELLRDWIPEFTNQCISALEKIGDEASIKEPDKAILAYSILLSLGPPTSNGVVAKWARMTLTRGPANDALNASTKFKVPRFIIYREICDLLEEEGALTEAIVFFRQMQHEPAGNTNICERVEWERGFQRRCAARLGELGSVAMDSENYNEAVEHFSTILSLDSVDRVVALIKRSKARVSMKLWEDALSDADEGIKLDPSSHRGYETRHAALHGARRHVEAVEAFRTMLLKLEESPDEHIRGLRRQYVDAASTIQHIVEGTVRDMPLVLIDTTTGSLYDKKHQADAFTALPIYNELISSMTTEIDYARIWREVKDFYRYVMLSHKWEDGEPLLQMVEHVTVYKLELSSANMKLQDFCTLVRSLGFHWAWSDTCCVDRDNKRVLEESLVAMFTWYRGSSLTIIYLRGVSSLSRKPNGLRGSLWNTRAWTYQEYVAAKAVKFYTEDWKPYLELTMFNHKDSPAVILEMQQATAGSAKDITILNPGLDRVREKLSLASMRKATLVEDIAYSLLGIFNASISIQYGERDRAVGRLLEYVLTGSGDVTVLAWTGRAGSYNSCLPVDLTVYNQVHPPHVPQPIKKSDMDGMVVALRSSLHDLSLVIKLYERINELPSPSSAASRLRLPGMVFRLTRLVRTSSDAAMNLHIYRATTSIFGDIEVETTSDLTKTKSLHLVHPWIRPLLDQEFEHGAAELDETTQAIRFVARLRQAFGAFLMEQVSRMEYRRVAADSLIMVRVREEVSLADLIQSIRTIEVQ